MSLDSFPIALQMPLAVLAGYAAGLLHFRSLAVIADRMLDGRLSAVGLQLARLAALGLFLYLCAIAGAAVLIGAAVGVMLGRARALRGVR